MFKNILPTGKRSGSSEDKSTVATSVFPPANDGKENNRPSSLPQISQRSPSKTSLPHSMDGRRAPSIQTLKFQDPKALQAITTDREFEKLLDDLQIPPAMRSKLAGMEQPVKAAMLKSSHVLTQNPVPVTTKRKLRRSLSSNHIESPRKDFLDYDFPPPPRLDIDAPLAPPVAPFMADAPRRPSSPLGHSRGLSGDTLRPNHSGHNPKASVSKAAGKTLVKDISPLALCTTLAETSSTRLELEVVKKLRLMLRNETASWSAIFLQEGGYDALLTRLIEILEVEWREEQHDDQVLHELLRCFKALSTSAIGCAALRSACPTPFAQLIRLLYSDKKPGDVGTRQLIVDLLLILFELYPSNPHSSIPQNIRQRREAFELSASQPAGSIAKPSGLPAPHKTLFSFIRSLLLTPAPPPSEAPSTPVSPHEFIASLHQPRIYKTYLRELSDICRDYFWVFCHPQNTLWNLDVTDEAKVERPRAPGGMTGGVEFEAMGYLTTHFQFVNALAKLAQDTNLQQEDEHSAYRFHADLFASGFERIILTTRKASTTYYGTLHLEISRYVALAGRAKFNVPWNIARIVGQPPAHLLKVGVVPANASPRSSPTKPKVAPGAPNLPTPKKVEPMKF
ncbi:hypothetical protein M422DRAFT_26843 [Sphaerobolus stellatus SS14]|nr:hypothetical protein M422DRAFT_26843 [Sphaerobolus stellatus SS14]